MRWPWGSEFTFRQAEETAKYFLSISQATLIGAVGSLFIPGLKLGISVFLFITGIVLGVFFYLVAMKLLKGVNRHE